MNTSETNGPNEEMASSKQYERGLAISSSRRLTGLAESRMAIDLPHMKHCSIKQGPQGSQGVKADMRLVNMRHQKIKRTVCLDSECRHEAFSCDLSRKRSRAEAGTASCFVSLQGSARRIMVKADVFFISVSIQQSKQGPWLLIGLLHVAFAVLEAYRPQSDTQTTM